MDSRQLRELGAHLRDAADAQERAGEDYDDFARRALRISRSLAGAGEISGRLHPEAAGEVSAAFEEPGAKADPDDNRTKAQRWADALTRLVALAGYAFTDRPGEPDDDLPGPAEGHAHDDPAGADGHGDPAGDGHGGPARHEHDRPAATAPPGLRRPRVIVGRKSPGWTPRQRDALYAQYGGRCGRDGCTHPIDVIHHVIHWITGGRTCITNGMPLCRYDHWLVHEGGWRVITDPSGRFTLTPPPPGWQPGTIYRRDKPVTETATGLAAA